jgi:predicted nucleic acid-binding protein
LRLYLDSSVVVGLFAPETHSSEIRAVLREYRMPLVSSDLVRLEVTAAFGKKALIQAMLIPDAHMNAQLADRWLLTETTCLPLARSDFEAAKAMLTSASADRGLRAPDALQMAIAARAEAMLFTNDKLMLSLAPDFGIKTVSIQNLK